MPRIIVCHGCHDRKTHHGQGFCEECFLAKSKETWASLKRCATCKEEHKLVRGMCLRCYHKDYRARRRL